MSVESKILDRLGDMTVFLAFDQAQIEIRVMAELSNDKRLIEVISSGLDIHQAVGHDLTGMPPETFAKGPKRVWIKSRHFAIVYGKTVRNSYEELIAQGVETTEEEVQEFYDNYFGKYAKVKKYIEHCHEFADEHGYIETPFGFRREIAKEKEGGVGASWQNQAVNSPIQGTAHLFILIAIAQKKKKPKTYRLLSDMIAEVHDALYFRTTLRNLSEGYKLGKYLLEEEVKVGAKKRFDYDIRVPLLAEAKVGFRLGAMMEGYKGGLVSEFLYNWIKYNAETDKKIAESLKKVEIN